jgi:hypothetical protein
MAPDDAEVEANMGVFLRNSLGSREGVGASWAARAGQLLQVSCVCPGTLLGVFFHQGSIQAL